MCLSPFEEKNQLDACVRDVPLMGTAALAFLDGDRK